mmetsp:Transcript_26052/g.59166  ORF Transcript_26052/g.59166 Transcript_26052/m.59166 type:complete len:265 (+) Transcript_26052:90-884(+)
MRGACLHRVCTGSAQGPHRRPAGLLPMTLWPCGISFQRHAGYSRSSAGESAAYFAISASRFAMYSASSLATAVSRSMASAASAPSKSAPSGSSSARGGCSAAGGAGGSSGGGGAGSSAGTGSGGVGVGAAAGAGGAAGAAGAAGGIAAENLEEGASSITWAELARLKLRAPTEPADASDPARGVAIKPAAIARCSMRPDESVATPSGNRSAYSFPALIRRSMSLLRVSIFVSRKLCRDSSRQIILSRVTFVSNTFRYSVSVVSP